MECSAIIFKDFGIKEEFFKDRGSYEGVFLVPRPLKMKALRPFEKPENINLATEHHVPFTGVHQQFTFSFCIQVLFLGVDVINQAVIYQSSFDMQ
jgi:hypothetical protein